MAVTKETLEIKVSDDSVLFDDAIKNLSVFPFKSDLIFCAHSIPPPQNTDDSNQAEEYMASCSFYGVKPYTEVELAYDEQLGLFVPKKISLNLADVPESKRGLVVGNLLEGESFHRYIVKPDAHYREFAEGIMADLLATGHHLHSGSMVMDHEIPDWGPNPEVGTGVKFKRDKDNCVLSLVVESDFSKRKELIDWYKKLEVHKSWG